MDKRSGMARKLDEVGRIVIPKEIRTYLALKEGSKLEIAINDIGEVILRKSGGGISDSFARFGDVLREFIDMSVVLVIDGVAEASFGINTIGYKASASVLNVISGGATYFACEDDMTTIMPILIDSKINIRSQIICPIIQDGISRGALVCIGDNAHIDVWQVKVAEFVAKVIGG